MYIYLDESGDLGFDFSKEKDRPYSFMARQVIDNLPISDAKIRIYLHLDKSKNKREIKEFNDYLFSQLKGSLKPTIPLEIYHKRSEEEPGIQAADMFCWGIFRKYERKDEQWYQMFKDNIEFEDVYLPFNNNKKRCTLKSASLRLTYLWKETSQELLPPQAAPRCGRWPGLTHL